VIDNDDMGYHVVTTVGDIDEKQIHFPVPGDIKIIPVIAGAKSGFFKVLFGAALIGLSFWNPASGLMTSTFGATSISLSSIAFSVGTSLALGGISQLLAPSPKSAAPVDAPNNLPSFAFDGANNSVVQGNAVPVGYGRMRVGSTVISSGLSVENFAAAATTAPIVSGGGLTTKDPTISAGSGPSTAPYSQTGSKAEPAPSVGSPK